jgi:putative acetyltransferase
VEALGPRDYTAEQVAAWASLTPAPDAFHGRLSDGRAAFVAVDDIDAVTGFIDLEDDGHIDLLYCAPEAAGTGAAGALYEGVEALAHERGIARLYSEASEGALRFFVKRGFTMQHRRDLSLDGVAIHNYAVEKILK